MNKVFFINLLCSFVISNASEASKGNKSVKSHKLVQSTSNPINPSKHCESISGIYEPISLEALAAVLDTRAAGKRISPNNPAHVAAQEFILGRK